jgi:NADH-quinone oxidoreductase subunit L
MFAALGCGQGQLASFAVTAAIFHLFTHAFFKALLFLASGSVMHAMGGIIDMRRFSGLRKAMPITHITFACGAFALAGLPPFAGFWSKDEILAVDWEASQFGNYHSFYFVIFVVLLFAALLTAFYTSRAYFRTFWGELKVPDEAGSHAHGDSHENHGPGEAHESPSVMTIPLIVLAIGAVSVGFILSWHHLFANFLAKSPNVTLYLGHHEHELNFPLMAVSSAIALAGIVTAWFMYVKRPEMPGRLANRFPTLYRASLYRFYFDEIYGWIAEGPLVVLAIISRIFDLLIDGIVDFVGRMPKVIGGLLRPIQNGLVQFYALAMILGLTVFLGILAFRR